MKNLLLFFILSSVIPEASIAMVHDTIQYDNFGKIIVYHPAKSPDALVLFLSGENGWVPAIARLATQLSDKGAMVVGINSRYYLNSLKKEHSNCYYPAGDFESLSLYLQKKYKLRNYLKPILIGYSSGATLAYGALAQAPANTFKGAISIGFCPTLLSVKPLCEGTGLKLSAQKGIKSWYLDPSGKLTAPFILLAGTEDKTCAYADIESYSKKVANCELVPLPNTGHDFINQNNWLPQLVAAYEKVKNAPSYAEMVAAKNQIPKNQQPDKLVTDLPLVILPCTMNDTLPLVIFISGDGGWTSFDEGVAEHLVEKGIPVIGVDAQKYFWQARTPEETTAEISKVLHFYLTAWNKKSFILCGYSFGADIIPYLLTSLPVDLSPKLKSAVMMSPDPKADFEIHVTDMLSFGSSSDKYDVVAELKKSSARHIVCIFGQEEESQSNKLFKAAGANIKLLQGTHHYNSDFKAVSTEIVNSFLK